MIVVYYSNRKWEERYEAFARNNLDMKYAKERMRSVIVILLSLAVLSVFGGMGLAD